jgi:hypothetical protein
MPPALPLQAAGKCRTMATVHHFTEGVSMPTIYPRITITLDVEEYAVLARVSELQKRPMSRIVVELLREMTPGLRRMADTMELALEARESVTRSLRRAVAEADPMAAELMKHFKELEGERVHWDDAAAAALQEEAAGGKRSAPVVSLPGGDPRPVITGVRKTQKKAKTAVKSSGYKRRA